MINIENSKIDIYVGDITEATTDAIVNAANNTLLGGGGVDGAIHRVGGKTILTQCKKIGGCPTGEARITTAGDLPSKYVIHTVGPIYDGTIVKEKLLYGAYYNSLRLADEYNLKSITFPSISTGAYKYPIEEASRVAITAIKEYLNNEESKIDLIKICLFSDFDYEVYERVLENI